MNRFIASVTAYIFSSVFAGSAIAVDLPYTGGKGDPLDLTNSGDLAAQFVSACEFVPRSSHVEVPYTGGTGDPLGLTSSTSVPGGKQIATTALCNANLL